MGRGNKKLADAFSSVGTWKKGERKEVEDSGKSAGLDMFVIFPG